MQRLTLTPARVVGRDIVDPDTNVEEEALARVEAGVLHTRLKLLPGRERQALIWSFGLNGVGKLTLEEIGERLGCSESWASRLRKRGLDRLRQLYSEQEGESPANGSGPSQARLNGTRNR
jgi:RNA polymerase sigma factor (sigma-70 family)